MVLFSITSLKVKLKSKVLGLYKVDAIYRVICDGLRGLNGYFEYLLMGIVDW